MTINAEVIQMVNPSVQVQQATMFLHYNFRKLNETSGGHFSSDILLIPSYLCEN